MEMKGNCWKKSQERSDTGRKLKKEKEEMLKKAASTRKQPHKNHKPS